MPLSPEPHIKEHQPESTPYLPVPPPGEEAPGVSLDGDGGHADQLVQVTDQVPSAVFLEDDGCPGLFQSSGSDGFPWVKRWQCEWVARTSDFTMNHECGQRLSVVGNSQVFAFKWFIPMSFRLV